MYKKYEEMGIHAFLDSEYEIAKSYFSLAYHEKPQVELLFFIEMCEFGLYNDEEAQQIYEFYMLYKDETDITTFIDITDNRYEKILSQTDEYGEDEQDINEQDSICYKEFNAIVGNKNFKQIFENIIFSTNMSFGNQDEALTFLDILVDHGFLDISLNYIEITANSYIGNERFAKILEKIKNNENSNSK